jgi:UDP-N-acetylglucosamine 1-carboxyvinyltransferase
MQKLIINGGKPLEGKIQISGAKNAALPIMAAIIATSKPVTLSNVPDLSDIKTMCELLMHLGADIKKTSINNYQISVPQILDHKAPYDIVCKMRASVIVLGGLLARNGYAEVSLPGGCAIGTRPINLHLMALEKLGAKIELEDGYVKATAKNGLKGNIIEFPIVSVGATENTIIAASLAEGETIIKNAATEPEICDLANFLNILGAKIENIGNSELKITGVKDLKGGDYKIMSDRIEAGTYAVLAPITKGNILIEGISSNILTSTLDAMEKMGVKIQKFANSFECSYNGKILPADVETEVHPGFPTDMQAQITALMCVAEGVSYLKEHIFENRFMHIPELMRMGADIEISGNSLKINGIKQFKPAEVMATDLRASSSLILAGLNANGQTIINRLYHLDRGYEKLEEKLINCGADVKRV